MDCIEIFGFTSGLVTASGMMPQLVKTIKTREVEELSLVMFVVYLIGFSMWITYGVIRDDLPIIVTNSFSFVLTVTMIILKIKFRNN